MRRARAFTLIELMVVMLVATVLAFFAVSGWQSHRERARRAAAGAALVATLAQLELRHARTGTFDAPESPFPGAMPHAGGYTIEVQHCADRSPTQCVEVVARSLRAETACGKLILSNTGERRPADPACWP